MYSLCCKRALDIVIALAALAALTPLLLLIALAIYLEDRAAPLFRQQRVGRDGVLFRIFKFRSMPQGAANIPKAEAAALRITRVGRVIRRTNIDELPQLLNVLRGEMSIVGPRPPLPAQAALCELRRRNGAMRCRPGLTGMAQVHAFDGITDEQKAAFDGAYAARVSFWLDCRLIMKTFVFMLRRPPVY
jgi:O-antigen biosynthesis protein WbqP